ncbi:MAG: DUF3090 family protein [Acidimicrobiia bacterium]
MSSEDLGPAEVLLAAAIGRPGDRTFFVHVVTGGDPYWFVAEKAQIDALADRSLELLAEAGHVSDPDAVTRILDAFPDEPGTFIPRFRIGSIVLRATEGRELVTVELGSVDEDDEVTFQVAPEQLQAMAARAREVVGAGREVCEFCRLPMDPAGHQCPATNGHHPDR